MGYLFGDGKRPVKRESKPARIARLEAEKTTAKELRVLYPKMKQPRKCKKKRATLSLPMVPELTWTPFNYPLQSDVLLSFLDCRRPFNKWRLLGPALNKPSAAKRDVKLETHHPIYNKRLYCAYIPLVDSNPYYAPSPLPCWKNTGYILENNKAWFPDSDVARGYTVIMYLLHQQRRMMDSWFGTLLKEPGNDFVPHRLQITARKRDPKKMIVLYDNDEHRNMVPMAVVLKVCMGEGVFAMVDDFGRIIQHTCHRFIIENDTS
jgi:hypothetical protein